MKLALASEQPANQWLFSSPAKSRLHLRPHQCHCRSYRGRGHVQIWLQIRKNGTFGFFPYAEDHKALQDVQALIAEMGQISGD